jgi:hypothetical protein
MRFEQSAEPWLELLEQEAEEGRSHRRAVDVEIAQAMGWRVSQDPWWNWHPGPRYDPPGDEWCIRRDGRNDLPCNEALPRFTANILRNELTQ